MQQLKDDIRNRILEAAGSSFSKNGFLKTSMRGIAERSGVGLGNIYHYFASKDELFCMIVRPVVRHFEQMLREHHGMQATDRMYILGEDYFRLAVSEYIALIRRYRDLLALLLFRAQGSSLENFKERFTEQSTGQVKLWLTAMKQKHPDMNTDFSDLFIHLHTVWMFALFEEVIMRGVSNKEMERLVEEYINFEVQGWKKLLNLSA